MSAVTANVHFDFNTGGTQGRQFHRTVRGRNALHPAPAAGAREVRRAGGVVAAAWDASTVGRGLVGAETGDHDVDFPDICRGLLVPRLDPDIHFSTESRGVSYRD